MTYTVGLLTFAAVGLLSWAVLSAVFSQERAVKRRLDGLSAYESAQALEANPQLNSFGKRVLQPSAVHLRNALSSVAPTSYMEGIRRKLVLAGSPRGMDASRFVLIKVLAAIAFGAVALAVAVLLGVSAIAWLLLALITIGAFWLPDVWLSSSISQRQRKIRIELPDLLDMLTISVEAGLGFDQAVAKVVRMSSGPLQQEFARTLQSIQAGTDRSDALRGLVQRTEVSELNAFVTAIVQAEQLGIPIANVLRIQAKELRLARRQRAEEQGAKTPVKMVFPLILCILPATLIVILGPAVISIGRVFGAW